MGNEHSKSKEPLNRNGGLPEKHRNGSANGLSAHVSSNGVEIAVHSDTILQQNSEPLALNPATKSNGFVVVESDRKSADAPDVSEAVEPIALKEEVKESNEDQTDVSLPATDPQTESTSRGEEAATAIVAVHRENVQCPHRKAETSTQTNRKNADISTQTDEDDEDATTDIEGPVEEVVAMEAAAAEAPLNESLFVIIEEFVEETANEEPVDNQTSWLINEDVVMESIAHENIVFKAEQVKVTDIKIYHPEEESVNGRDETEPDIATEADSNEKESFIEDEIVAEGNDIEESLSLEVFYSLPKVVADCVKLVFAAVPQATDFASVKTAVPIAEEVTAEDNDEGAEDISGDVVLTETAEPQSSKLVNPESIAEDRTAAGGIHLEEEEITATTDVSLSGDEEDAIVIPEKKPVETIAADETNGDAIEASSNELQAAPESVEEDTTNVGEEPADVTPMDATGEPEPRVSIQEEVKDEVVAPTKVQKIEDEVSPMDATAEPEPRVSIQEEVKDENVAAAEAPTDSSHVVDADLEAIVEEILTERAECNLVTSEEEAPEVIVERETESRVNSTDSTPDSQSVTRTDVEAFAETADLKQESEPLTEPESVTPDSGPEGENADKSDNGNSQPVENQEEENPVMNFFKNIVTSKISKKETATADATKDQSQKENQPAATTTVAQVSEPPAAPKGMSIPPPPPPEPPKMEIKAEPAAKPVKPAPKEEPKAAAKKPESSKGKSGKDTLSRFFRSKVLLGVKASKGKGASASGAKAPAKSAAVTNKDAPPQPAVEVVEVTPVVEVQEIPVEVPEPVVVEVKSESNVEPNDTAEQVAQPVVDEQIVKEVPQPAVEAEKVDSSKAGTLEAAAKPEPPPPVQEAKKTDSKSSFFSLFKPKANAPTKATPAPAAAVETVKAKEEPKAAAKSSEAVVDSKPAAVASQTGGDAANAPKKLEKRNSIQLFFKILGQKRNSTDAGIQTEAVTVAPAAEKAK